MLKVLRNSLKGRLPVNPTKVKQQQYYCCHDDDIRVQLYGGPYVHGKDSVIKRSPQWYDFPVNQYTSLQNYQSTNLSLVIVNYIRIHYGTIVGRKGGLESLNSIVNKECNRQHPVTPTPHPQRKQCVNKSLGRTTSEPRKYEGKQQNRSLLH